MRTWPVYILVILTILLSSLNISAQLNCSGGACGNFPLGSAALPAIWFGSDNTTGIYRDAANVIRFAVAGVREMSLGTGGLQLLGNNLTYAVGAAGSLGIGLSDANTLEIDNAQTVPNGGSLKALALTDLKTNGNLSISGTAPTVSSGCGSVSTPTFGTGSTAASWSLTMGSTPGTSCVITLPTAVNQWICFADDISTITDATSQATPLANNAATLKPAGTWGASDMLVGKCIAH